MHPDTIQIPKVHSLNPKMVPLMLLFDAYAMNVLAFNSRSFKGSSSSSFGISLAVFVAKRGYISLFSTFDV